MSISFSGLASGLDTSSWVESLVRLKQAKITTLEEQKENVLLSKETLNGIKAFFSSFRATIEKITDTKFGVASMDLFAQNLATSSNVSVLTGIATAEAEESTYNILVDKLATETNALSNYNYMTTIVQTTTATNDSKLIHLGVKAGNIGVTVNGIERGINITENDTIATFIEKLREIGAEASYNEKTGVFSINISDNAINDIDGTGIVDALHLRGVNEGYASNNLQTSNVDTVFSAATESTLMKDLGVSAGVVGIKANDTTYNVTLTNSTTLGDFINTLKSNNIDASIDSEGVFTITDAEIVSEGSTNILSALGLESGIFDKSQSSGNLVNQTIITQTTTATSDTLLKDLGEGTTVNNNSTVIVKNSNNEFSTITVGATSTVGDLLSAINNAGLSATINSDGVVEINGGTITGGSFDAVSALGLESSPYTAIVTGNPLTETIETKENVTLNTRLVEDLGVSKGYLEVTDNDGNKNYLKVYSGQTFANLKSELEAYGLSVSLDETNGVLNISGGSFKALTDSEVASLVSGGKITESDATYRKGTDLLEHLYGAGTISTDHITVESAYAKSQALNHTVTSTVNATLTTTLEELGLAADGTAIFDVSGTKQTINVSKTMTMQGLIDAINAKGISANWDDDASKLTIENATISGGTSNLSSVLGLSETIHGKYTTSDALHAQATTTVEATRETTLKDFGITNSMTAAQRTVNLYDSEGSHVGAITVTEATTIGSLVDFINSKTGISASIENGVFKINDGYISNAALEASMGLEKSNSSSYVLGTVNTTTIKSTVTGESKLGDIISAMGTTSSVSGGYNLTFDGKSISVDANSSLNDVINEIFAKGGSASLDSTGRLSVTGGVLAGSVADALGVTSVTDIASISSNGKTLTTSKEVYADRNTALSELGVSANSTFTIKKTSGDTVVTVGANTTIGDFFDILKSHGIDGTISDGVITLQSDAGNYIEGAVAVALGISKRTTTTIVNTTQYSTVGVTCSETVVASLTSTLGEIGGVSSSGTNDIKIFDKYGTCIDTMTGLSADKTLQEMFYSLSGYGINGSIDANGVISLNSTNGNYVGGTIMDRLGIHAEFVDSETTTVAMSVISSSPLTTSVSVTATADTTFGDITNIDIHFRTLNIVRSDGCVVSTILVTNSMTIQDLCNEIGSFAECSFQDGHIVINQWGYNPFTFEGSAADALALSTSTVSVGKALTSTAKVTYSVTTLASATDKVSDYVSIMPKKTTAGIIDSYGNVTGTIVAISTAEDLQRIARGSMNNKSYAGVTFVLQKDIELSDSSWEGIGRGTAFAGTFDGQGHSIKLNISRSLFESVSGAVERLSVYGTVGKRARCAGGVTATLAAGGTIDNCTSSVRFDISDLDYAGGLVGYLEDSACIKYSLVSGITCTSPNSVKIGGLVGVIATVSTPESTTSITSSLTHNSILVRDNIGNNYYAIGHYTTNAGQTVAADAGRIADNKWYGSFGGVNGGSIDMVSLNASGTSATECLSRRLGSVNSLIFYDSNYTQVGSMEIDNSTKFSDIISKASSYGITASFDSNNKLKFSGGSAGGRIANTLGTKSVQTVEENDATLNTTLSELGVTTSGGLTIYNPSGGSKRVTVLVSDTIGEFIDKLNEAGCKASFNDGKITIGEDDSGYYLWHLTGSYQTAFNLTDIFGCQQKHITTSDMHLSYINPEISYDTQIKDATQTSVSYGITVIQGATEKVVNVSAYDTFAEMFDKLKVYGVNGSISDGKVQFDCDEGSYIKGMSSGLNIHLGLSVGENKSYTSVTKDIYRNTNSSKLYSVDSSVKISGDTVLSSIDPSLVNGDAISINKADGHTVTLEIDGSETINELFNKLADYGITGTVDSDGKVTISASNGVSWNYRGKLWTALNFSDIEIDKVVSGFNTSSKVLKHNITTAATTETTLEELPGLTFNSLGETSIGGTITDKSGKTEIFSIDISKTSTIGDVIDELAKVGIIATLDARGKFSVSTNSLQDFDISGPLGTYLMGSYTKDYDINSIVNMSNSLSENKVIKMNDSTKLSDLGITGGDILINKNGSITTVNVDMTTLETVGDFRDFLSYQGFTSNIYNQGRMSVTGVGDSSLANITGGSNILTVLGLTDWIMNDVSQSSEILAHENVETKVVNMSNKLSELTNASGASLGITSGQVAVYHNGTRNVLNIDENETLDSLANKLSRCGITVNLASDGKLYFNGSNNSYLSKDGIAAGSLSNILDKIGIADTWTTSGSSSSKKLNYQEQKLEKIDMNTKLSELKDASGNSLGLTDGAFYVYSNGVRNTETLNTNMSVGDFISLMDNYGINAEIMSDGSIALKANANSYLETSSGSGNNSNIVSKLFNNYEFKKTYASDKLEVTNSDTKAITRDTKLSDIDEGTYNAGFINVVKDGVNTKVEFSADDTVGSFIDKLALYGFNATINGNGQLVMNSTGNSELKNYTGVGASNVLDILGVNEANWIKTNKYEGDELNVIKKSTTNVAATRDTLMSELGVTAGEYYIYNNGVKYTAMISSDETLGSFMDTLKTFGLETSIVEKDGSSVLSVVGKGNSYVAKSASVSNASNVVEKLFTGGVSTSYEYTGLQQTSETVTTYSAATEDTLLSYFDNGALKAQGDLSVSVNGVENTIKITADETFGSLINKLNALGVEATLTNGQLMIQSGYDSFTINTSGTTSNLQATLNLLYDNDLGGYVASSDTVLATTTTIEEKTLSVSNYADDSTKLGLLNISNGALTVYRNGQKATIQINSEETFGDLKTRLSTAFSDLDLKFEDGYLTIYSKDGNNVEVGSTTDTTNFSAITGVTKAEDGTVRSARELYCVNTDSVVTNSGLFRSGNVNAGTFIVGSETFTIDDKTTLADVISQINSNEKANATAYWDNIKGRLVIKSRTTGAAYVNIEAGTSNFTDVMGFTTSEWNPDGSLKSTRLNINTQEIGQNAKISINGTNFTSTSNTITSDVSRIKGLTIKLNGLTEGSAVTLTVEKDKETLANAVSDVVDSYNELMKNVDEAIKIDGKLHNETTLKMIRNNLRNLMTSSDAGTTVYRNLSAIGISTSTASANNVSTTNESVINLAFDKEKFIKAYEADSAAVKALLAGSENNKGVFTKVEELMESTLQAVSGYFASADNSFTRKAETIERKIVNGTKQIERYRARLEARFSSMDMLIANMQQQYSSFLVS